VIEGCSYAQRYFEDIGEDETLPTTRDHISYRRIIMNPGATWDYFPGHHDTEYASQKGQPTIYVNTMHFMGFIDRLATEWAGPESFITRRWMAMRRSIYAGDTMVGEGRVTGKRSETSDGRTRYLVDLDIMVKNQDGLECCPAAVTVELPSRSSA
jgi:acyl dehydratase